MDQNDHRVLEDVNDIINNAVLEELKRMHEYKAALMEVALFNQKPSMIGRLTFAFDSSMSFCGVVSMLTHTQSSSNLRRELLKAEIPELLKEHLRKK